MPFWEWNDSDHPAIITLNNSYSYKMLNEDVEQKKRLLLTSNKRLLLLLMSNEYEDIVMYLAALRAGHAVMIVNNDIDDDLLNNIVNNYNPFWLVGKKEWDGYESHGMKFLMKIKATDIIIHRELSLLLSTSGTTGSRKFVKLSYNNIQSNAISISDYLNLTQSERGVVNLPLSYSYGLSILNSHLQRGATVVLTNESMISEKFWAFIKQVKATSFAGVPFTYQMLSRFGFFHMDLPHLRMFTQAGGRLNKKYIHLFGEYAEHTGKKFYVMYGQTEASPRMSYIPPNQVLKKAGSIGVPIPGGQMDIDSHSGELIYRGPNVMLGYANCLDDLSKGDELNNVLHTGDLAIKDQDGFFTIIGRIKRFIKLFGLRVNLDEVERSLEESFNVPIVCSGKDDKMIILIESENIDNEVGSFLETTYQINSSAFKTYCVSKIPRLENGKIDYSIIKNDYIR